MFFRQRNNVDETTFSGLLPQTYLQQIPPQFYTMFDLVSDKQYSVQMQKLYDGGGEEPPIEQTIKTGNTNTSVNLQIEYEIPIN